MRRLPIALLVAVTAWIPPSAMAAPLTSLDGFDLVPTAIRDFHDLVSGVSSASSSPTLDALMAGVPGHDVLVVGGSGPLFSAPPELAAFTTDAALSALISDDRFNAFISQRDGHDIGITVNPSPRVITPSAIPEPATLVLLGAGLTGLTIRARRSRSRA